MRRYSGYQGHSSKYHANGKSAQSRDWDAVEEWKIDWQDEYSFKIEFEGYGIRDDTLKRWIALTDRQFRAHFAGKTPELLAHGVNLSWNEITDSGVSDLLVFFQRHRVSVQRFKLYRNLIGDAGATSIGNFAAESKVPCQELHLSHNHITERGVCAMLDAVERSKRYPCAMPVAQAYSKVTSPLWLRLEMNCVTWHIVEEWLAKRKVKWCTASVRDGWHPKKDPPAFCLHKTYHETTAEQQPDRRSHDSVSTVEPNDSSDTKSGVPDDFLVARDAEARPKTQVCNSLETAFQILAEHGDVSVPDRWRKHLAVAEDPQREVGRIKQLLKVLRIAGYLDDASSDALNYSNEANSAIVKESSVVGSDINAAVVDEFPVQAPVTLDMPTSIVATDSVETRVMSDQSDILGMRLLGMLINSTPDENVIRNYSPRVDESSSSVKDEQDLRLLSTILATSESAVPLQKAKKGANKMKSAA
eukprot:TRINITY_DN29987_c0_g1_i1.p1 TRINITY_DN29987_c0_g1~~TRINITY_DN29987_c0_g1_i1.p1  ORF type:complete len:473 (-),score=48.62 TRINITY_DN29987_c0_g1_i1:316-1734(-)